MDAQANKNFSFYHLSTWFREVLSYVKDGVTIFLFLIQINSYFIDNAIIILFCGKYATLFAASSLVIAAVMGFLVSLYSTILSYNVGEFQGNGQKLDVSSPALHLQLKELVFNFAKLVCSIYNEFNKVLQISVANLILSSISTTIVALKFCMKKGQIKKLQRQSQLSGNVSYVSEIVLSILSSPTFSHQGSSSLRGRLSPTQRSCLLDSTDAILQMELQLVRIACGRIACKEVSPETIDVLHLCSTLTRNHSVAVCFLEANGLKSLFNLATSSNFPGFDKIAATIIYHILEDPQTLQLAMESKINHILATVANGRLSPQDFLLKLLSILSRDPKIFMQAAQSICQIEMVGESPCIVSKLHGKGIFGNMKPTKSFIDTVYFLLDVINGFLPASIENAVPLSTDSGSVSKENKTSREASAMLSKVIFVVKFLTKIMLIYPSTIHVVLDRDVGSTVGIVHHILHNRLFSQDLKNPWKHELAKQARQFLMVFCAHSIDARSQMLREISLILDNITSGINEIDDVETYVDLIDDLETYVDLINDVLAAASTSSYILPEASIALFRSLLQTLLDLGFYGSPTLGGAVIKAMEFVSKSLSTKIVSLSIHDSVSVDGVELFTTDYKELENPLSMDFSEVNLEVGLEKLDILFQNLRNSDDAQQSLAELLVYQLSLPVTKETSGRHDVSKETSGRNDDGGRKKSLSKSIHLVETKTLRGMIRLLIEQQLHRDSMHRILLNLCADDETRIALLKILMQKLKVFTRKPANTAEPSFQSYDIDGVIPCMVETLNLLTKNNPSVAMDLLQLKSSLPILLGMLNYLCSSNIALLTQVLSLLEVIINNAECKSLSTTVDSSIDSVNDEHVAEDLVLNLQQEELQPLCSCLALEGLSDDVYTLMVGVMKKLVAMSPRHCHLLVAGLANSLETLLKSSITKLSMFIEVSELHGISSIGVAILRVLQILDYLVVPKVGKNGQSEEHNACLNHYCAVHAMLNPLWFKVSWCLTKMMESYAKPATNYLLISMRSKQSGLTTPLPASSQNILPYIESFVIVQKKLNIGNCGVVDIGGGLHITFDEFCEKHKNLFNVFIRQNVGLLEKSFSFMLEVPFFLDYYNKIAYFRSKIKHHQNPLRISVTRTRIFQSSYEELCMRSAEDLRGELIVQFIGEEVTDAGILAREWYQLLKRDIFYEDRLLFTLVEKDKFQPLPSSDYLKIQLPFFKFVGRFVGKAVFDRQLLDVGFTRSFYKFMVGAQVTDDEIKAMDPVYFEKLKRMHEVSEDELKVRIDDRWNNVIKPIMSSFMEGFSELIPWKLISIFNDRELELLIA